VTLESAGFVDTVQLIGVATTSKPFVATARSAEAPLRDPQDQSEIWNRQHEKEARIDYIYYSRGATILTLKSSQVFDVRDSLGVMPSDHPPVFSVFTVR
jgi:endonuclease/exonuclease/phosphatase family metal-dependent hydrolase